MKRKIRGFLNRAYWTLDGWRFQDLKDFIKNSSVQQQKTPMLDLTFTIDAVMGSRDTGKSPDYAFISAMPPAETGVATCNFKTLVEADANVDVFSFWPTLESYAHFERQKSKGVNGYSAAQLPLFLGRKKYKTIVVSVGNSNEDIFAVVAATQLPLRNYCDNVVVHLHDGCLWNLASKYSDPKAPNLLGIIEKHYAEVQELPEIKRFFKEKVSEWQSIEHLVSRKLYGIRPIVQAIKPHVVCCNSTAAIALLKDDFRSAPQDFETATTFHPIFNSDIRIAPSPAATLATLRVGMFGIPSKAKGSELVAQACAKLTGAGKKVVLVMAGFGVEKFAKEIQLDYPTLEVEYLPSSSDTELLSLMDTVHLAVQLRKRNLGESSGVVASLVAKNVPTIVSDVGAFKDYAPCCFLIPADSTVQTISNAILQVSSSYDKKQADSYIQTKSASALCKLWFESRSNALI
jgi:glycosyltransferase involved in cell wall biosynthesis